jgi:hypothetical protein
MNKTFKIGEYIVTSCGFRGYVVQRIEGTSLYEIRLAGGITVRSAQELEHDDLMDQED